MRCAARKGVVFFVVVVVVVVVVFARPLRLAGRPFKFSVIKPRRYEERGRTGEADIRTRLRASLLLRPKVGARARACTHQIRVYARGATILALLCAGLRLCVYPRRCMCARCVYIFRRCAVYTFIYIYMYIYMYIRTHIFIDKSIYIRTSIHMCIYLRTYTL